MKGYTKIASVNGNNCKIKKIRKREFIINLTKPKQICKAY